MARKILADYHKKYPIRLGDTVEKFERYERFCREYPEPQGKGWHNWYARLAEYMEK